MQSYVNKTHLKMCSLTLLSPDSRDGKALERFLQDYFDGKLKRYLKSEPIPENNEGPVKVKLEKLFISV